jgi:hypothetical protein
LQICRLEQRNATLQVRHVLNIQHFAMITEGFTILPGATASWGVTTDQYLFRNIR